MPDKEINNIGYRPTWAEVDLSNLAHNYYSIKRLASPKIKVMVTVKADAYGHGLIPVSKKLVSCGVDYLGVASIDEGIKLRQVGITKPILVLGHVLEKDIAPVFIYGLAQTVSTPELAKALEKKARSLNKQVNVHIKVDTGMGRLGVLHHQALRLIEKVRQLKGVRIEGIFTHLALADMDEDFTHYQIDAFNALIMRLHKLGIRIPLIHAANSMGAIGYSKSHFNMIRPGLAIYGLYPKENLSIHLKPVLSLKTKVIYTKKVPQSYGISYGHEYITSKPTRIVILPIGYGDGYPRNLSNQGPVLIKGKSFRVSGRVCMDQMMCDVHGADVKVGDEAVLIGAQGRQRITTEELALLCGTIPYEIVCGLGSRIPRVYKK
jgi:alanine racemase